MRSHCESMNGGLTFSSEVNNNSCIEIQLTVQLGWIVWKVE